MDHLVNSSVIGRLLEEISWEGKSVRAYRDGGRGRENVLTLADVLAKTPEVEASVDGLIDRLPETIAWITWGEIAEVTRRQDEAFRVAPDDLAGTIRRLAGAVIQAIEWHS